MTKKCYRFFSGLLQTQTNWLNDMAAKGYRLVRTGKILYEFEACKPGEYQYCVEFIGEKSRQSAQEYKQFLEDLGYKAFYKNLNLNFSIGKVRYRPWAEKGGRISTNATTFNKEILIVERKNDGKPFELHTSYEDKIAYTKNLRNPWLALVLMFLVLAVVQKQWPIGIAALVMLIPVILYQREIARLGNEARTSER